MTLLVVLLCLATYRATRLLVVDEFPPIAATRDWITDKAGPYSSIAYLVHCPWCTGMYVAAGLVAGTDLLTDWSVPVPALLILVASGVTGLIATVEPE